MKTTLNHFTTTELKMKLALGNTIVSVAAVLVASCASAPPTMVHEIVGPIPGVANEEQKGFLTVYSRTVLTTPPPRDAPSVLSYTDYEIDAANGTLFEQVANGDEEPTRVTLPKGTYTVVADSDTSGTVNVPVAIEAGKITVVHLEREKDWKEASARVRSADLVQLPNGQPIGFRARHAELLKDPMVRIAQSKHRPPVLEQ
jgi:major membrane immunogen (membrane-anchored lipoprotein)